MEPAVEADQPQSLTAFKNLFRELARQSTDYAAQIAQRRTKRYMLNSAVTLHIFNYHTRQSHVFMHAWGVDLSLHGIGMITEKPIMAGKELLVSFNILAPDCRMPIRVMHCVNMVGNLHRIGATFRLDGIVD